MCSFMEVFSLYSPNVFFPLLLYMNKRPLSPAKGKMLQEKLSDVPMTLGKAVLCGSVTPESAPSLFTMLDDIIGKLSEPTPVKK